MKSRASGSHPQTSSLNRFLHSPRALMVAAACITVAALALAIFYWWWTTRPPKPLAEVMTVAGPGLKIANSALPDLFGIAIDEDDRIFASDGAANSIYRINPDGSLTTITSELDMPSAIAFAPDGSLIVANTGAHTIARVNVETGQASLVAGAAGESGFIDGEASQARFNGPIGIAVNGDGVIFVADTYNDSIRSIDSDGRVVTIAGAPEPGLRDGAGREARFDTPCGLAIDADGSLLVADTANHRIRRVTPDGNVTTFAGTGEALDGGGDPIDAAFDQPMAIAVRRDGAIFVSDGGASAVRMITVEETRQRVATIAGGYPGGLSDGQLEGAKLNRPSSLAFASNDALAFADTGNGLIRAFVPEGLSYGFRSPPDAAILKAEVIRAAVPPRWPFDPPLAKRDIAGTFGEIRGEMLPDHDAWFHNGLDIPGGYGETVRAIFAERVTRPLAVESAGGGRERLLLPLISYIHLRVGRDQNDKTIGGFPNGAIAFRRDEQGQVIGVRVRRGTRINAGDAIGTLNRQYHVHLIAGPYGSENNALAALQFPGLVDAVPPVIEALKITDERDSTILDIKLRGRGSNALFDQKEIPVSGRLRIIASVYDQVDGNPRYRRLGAYRLGYQLLHDGGSPAPGFAEPRFNIVFDRLPADPRAVALAYAEGSQSGYEGATIFSYIVTNIVRGGEAREDFLDAAGLSPGTYILRVIAEDFFGNRSQIDLSIVIRESTPKTGS